MLTLVDSEYQGIQVGLGRSNMEVRRWLLPRHWPSRSLRPKTVTAPGESSCLRPPMSCQCHHRHPSRARLDPTESGRLLALPEPRQAFQVRRCQPGAEVRVPCQSLLGTGHWHVQLEVTGNWKSCRGRDGRARSHESRSAGQAGRRLLP